jgi:hypothetical protein
MCFNFWLGHQLPFQWGRQFRAGPRFVALLNTSSSIAFFVSLIKKRKTTERLTVGVADNEAGDVLVDRSG